MLDREAQAGIANALVHDVPLRAADQPEHEGQGDAGAAHRAPLAHPRHQHAEDEEAQERTLRRAVQPVGHLEHGAEPLHDEDQSDGHEAHD